MTALEEALQEAKIEAAQNEIRLQHNRLEATRFFGKKTYMPYQMEKVIMLTNSVSAFINK
jgi:hypothetical protein